MRTTSTTDSEGLMEVDPNRRIFGFILSRSRYHNTTHGVQVMAMTRSVNRINIFSLEIYKDRTPQRNDRPRRTYITSLFSLLQNCEEGEGCDELVVVSFRIKYPDSPRSCSLIASTPFRFPFAEEVINRCSYWR